MDIVDCKSEFFTYITCYCVLGNICKIRNSSKMICLHSGWPWRGRRYLLLCHSCLLAMDRPVVVLPCEWGVHSPRVVSHSWHARCFRRTLVCQRLVLSLNSSEIPVCQRDVQFYTDQTNTWMHADLLCTQHDCLQHAVFRLAQKKIQKRPKIASFYSSIIYINFSLVSWLQGLRRKIILILNITFLVVIRVSQRLVFVRPYNWGPKLLQIRQNNRHLLQKSQKKILPRYRSFSKDKGRITTQHFTRCSHFSSPQIRPQLVKYWPVLRAKPSNKMYVKHHSTVCFLWSESNAANQLTSQPRRHSFWPRGICRPQQAMFLE